MRVHVGTAEVLGKVVLLEERAEIPRRERGWAQMVLDEPVLALRGDRFILRDETARATLGGGVVVNPFADRHRRGEPGLADRLAALRDGDLATAARTLLELVPDFACDRAAVAQALGEDVAAVVPALAGAADVVPIPAAAQPEAWTTAGKWERLVADVLSLVTGVHAQNPTEAGVEMEHLRSQVAFEVSAKTFRWCVDRLVAARRLVRDDSTVRLPTHRVALDAGARALGERVTGLLADGRLHAARPAPARRGAPGRSTAGRRGAATSSRTRAGSCAWRPTSTSRPRRSRTRASGSRRIVARTARSRPPSFAT